MMKRVKILYKRAIKWIYDRTPIWCGTSLGLLFGFIEFLALAPYPYVEWFYGPKKDPKPEREIHVIYKNGVPIDTVIIEKYDENIMFDNNNSKLYGI